MPNDTNLHVQKLRMFAASQTWQIMSDLRF